jgi:hypothetical protein
MVKPVDQNLFKDMIDKLNDITDRIEEAENILADKVVPQTKNPTLIERPASPEKPVLTEAKNEIQMTISERFNALLNENIEPVMSEENTVTEYGLAVKTAITEEGIKIGHWEIKKVTEGKEIIYSIHNVESEVTILENIRTYGAASTIVKLLNAGKAANCREVAVMLRLDEDFRLNYQDAVHYRKKFLKTKNPIFEDRYEVCKGKALQLKETILRKCETLEII